MIIHTIIDSVMQLHVSSLYNSSYVTSLTSIMDLKYLGLLSVLLVFVVQDYFT